MITARRGSAWVLAATMLLCAAPGPARAQAGGGAASPTLEALRQKVDELEAQLVELRALLKDRESPSPPPAAPESSSAVRYGFGLDTYYGFNANRPLGRVNLLRTYDVMSNTFSLNQASVIVERSPDVAAGRRFGGRLDFQFGQATETLQGSPLNELRPWVYRNVFQAYGTFVAPVGSGLTVDVGKWTSPLGLEGNYTKDQMNYSRSFLFNALPFYHMGVRANYQLADSFAMSYGIANGTQTSESVNDFKDQFITVAAQPSTTVSWRVSYYLGQEHPDVQPSPGPVVVNVAAQPGLPLSPLPTSADGRIHIFDSYATWQGPHRVTLAGEAAYVISRVTRSSAPDHLSGGALYVQMPVGSRSALAARAEYLRDTSALFSGTAQTLREITLTYDRTFSEGFLVRTEWRRDSSDVPFFLTHSEGVRAADQSTATVGLMWWWGTKQHAW